MRIFSNEKNRIGALFIFPNVVINYIFYCITTLYHNFSRYYFSQIELIAFFLDGF